MLGTPNYHIKEHNNIHALQHRLSSFIMNHPQVWYYLLPSSSPFHPQQKQEQVVNRKMLELQMHVP